MQSEEIEETASPLEESSSKCEMTYIEQIPEITCTRNQKRDSLKFNSDEISFDLDSRKMIPDSPKCETPKQEDRPEDLRGSPQNEFEKSTLEHNTNENIRSWLQRITQMQTEIQRKLTTEQNQYVTELKSSSTTTSQAPSKVVKYQDLPYMGEMTLDNSKPRRGRKPKKADICHLIYKNYGTIYPGTPNSKNLIDSKKNETKSESPSETFMNRSDVQNRIISSLLEKRLTQESKRHKETLKAQNNRKATKQDEPLNLCIRDLNHLKIRLLRKNDVYSTESSPIEVKSEPQSDDDVEFVHETPSPSSSSSKEIKFPSDFDGKTDGVAPGGYVYWPSAGVFIHPMALQQHLMYYQKLASNNSYTLPSNSPRLDSASTETSELRRLAPKPKRKENTEENEAPPEQKNKRNAPSTSLEKTPTKRKRSAIFIPPIPAENQTNPATEVSICKFKFTGGAKPSLQEKKMLSVDSGGNFRYYSGTGDKSMRGYEFFPRETLQQQINAQGSSTGAFLQASGEKIFPSSPNEFPGKTPHDFMLTPEIQPPQLSLQEVGPSNKKRKSRKSLQREKLEQTFKEKGFLIQTQQLESAEGATYCKFRQLRKFTRYLFRSWKDYLPGISNEEERVNGNADGEQDVDLEHLSTLSNSELTSSDLRE